MSLSFFASGREGVAARGQGVLPVSPVRCGAFSPRCRVLPADVNPCGLDRGVPPEYLQELAGASAPVPLEGSRGARQFGKRGGHLGGAGNDRGFHAAVMAQRRLAHMRQSLATLIHAVRP